MSFTTDLLGALGAPASATNVEALSLWAQSEGMPASAHNPLACGQPWPGATLYNSVGVRNYPGEAAGVAATAQALRAGDFGYPAVVAALRANAGLVAIWQAVNASRWCGGCQTGHYPVALYTALRGAGAIAGPTTTAAVQQVGAATAGQQEYTATWQDIQRAAGPDAAALHNRLVAATGAARRIG